MSLKENGQITAIGYWKLWNKRSGEFSGESIISGCLEFNNLNKNFHRVLMKLSSDDDSVFENGCEDCGRSMYDDEENNRIVGGNETRIHEFPWQVGITLSFSAENRPFCGATLISKTCVLTAAHCMAEIQWPGQIKVLLGKHDWSQNQEDYQTTYSVKSIKIHPNYNDNISKVA